MASHKGLERAGLTALCDHIKETQATVGQLGPIVVQLSEALQDLSSELEGLINEVDSEVEDLAAAIIAGNVTAPQDKE